MNTCTGKVAIVTGSTGGGIGRSAALTLAREGAAIVVNYRRQESQHRAAEVVARIESQGRQAVAVRADVHTEEGCEALVDAAINKFDRVDICIIGPGAGWHPEPPDKLDAAAALTDAHHELAPIYHMLPLVLPGMYERRWGRIVGISLLPKDSPSYAYNVAKAARTEALQQLRKTTRGKGVTVNVIAPGEFEHLPSLQAAIDQCDGGGPWLERPNLSPQDMAEGIAFLCSDAGRFLSGCELAYQTIYS